MSGAFFLGSMPTLSLPTSSAVALRAVSVPLTAGPGTSGIFMQTAPLLALNESPNGAVGNTCRNMTVCRYFLRGNCRFGAFCRFSHDILSGAVNSNYRNENQNTFFDTPTSSFQAKEQFDKLARWAEAPAFIPRSTRMVYVPSHIETTTIAIAHVNFELNRNHKHWVGDSVGDAKSVITTIGCPAPGSVNSICPHIGPCSYGSYCVYSIHFEQCKMCDKYCLHPNDPEQRRKHNKECLQRHEQAMELSFAIARSRDKVCGICMDNIMEKPRNVRRFGILPQCNHVFCLECIRKWRQATDFEHHVIRSCPECRIASDFVCPSPFWVETQEQKDKLLSDYRAALGLKDCKYFKKGKGKCPFGNKCFYKHAMPNGKLVDVGSPTQSQFVQGEHEHFDDMVDTLWGFVELRDISLDDMFLNADDFSDDSDYSDDI